ncbi:MAG TPA: LysM domain-containing protein, partial [Hellea balneolensis]|nr:LysM domain-containing protein [Hellea balneolensis]
KKTLGTVAGAVIGGAAGYGIADKTINCDPVAVPINASTRQAPIAQPYQGAPATPASTAYTVAPTPAPQTSGGIFENTQSLGDVGTPGYYAVNGYPAPAPTPAPAMNANAGNSYPQPTPVPLQPQNIPSGFSGTQDHVIVTGDTVYSLARKSCVSVRELQSINGINDDYYIRVGESLKIPTGRCSIK